MHGVDSPRLSIVAAEPGAGKSVAINRLRKQPGQKSPPFYVNPDWLRLKHYNYEKIQDEDPLHMIDLTEDDIKLWRDILLDEARKRRANVIYEHTLRTARMLEKTIREYKADGYQIDLHCIAVNSKISTQSIFTRYADEELRKPNTGRIVLPISYHHENYESYPINAQHLLDQKLVDTVTVYNRERDLFKIASGDIDGKSGLVEKIISAERGKIWSQEEKNVFMEKWEGFIANRETYKKLYQVADFPVKICNEALPYIEEAGAFVEAVQATSEHLKQTGVVVRTSPHHNFVQTEDEFVAFDKSPLIEKPEFETGDAWILKSKPALTAIGGRFKPNNLNL
ncbi:MAG: zeta toxin family protein [Bdellovibrionales bacterium]